MKLSNNLLLNSTFSLQAFKAKNKIECFSRSYCYYGNTVPGN